MKDEIREKYRILLGTLGENKRVGEMTEKELLLGKTLKQMREHRQISLEDLSKGICAPSAMTATENGIKASLLMTGAYLTRMGKSVNKFEFYSTNLEYEQQCKRDNIIELWKTERLAEAGKYLAEYDRQFRSKFCGCWSKWQKYCIMLREGELPREHKEIWEELTQQKLYFTQEEMDYLWELAKLYKQKNQVEYVRQTYHLMYQNTMATGVFLPQNGRGMDEERKLEILPELCLCYGRFEHMQGRNQEAVQILSTAITLLQESMRMKWLRELLEERGKNCYELWKNEENKEAYEQMGRDMQYLIALDLVHGQMCNVLERVRWLKEEVKWENIILDNLSIDPEKLLD